MNVFNFINSKSSGFYAILGKAGSGKSTLSLKIANNSNIRIVHLDDFFIGDSLFRKELLENKLSESLDEYIDACNQFSWWDWNRVYEILKLEKNTGKITVFEGAFLGPQLIWPLFDNIFLIDISDEIRFKRLIDRDLEKRGCNEFTQRFLITQYSETIHYSDIFKSEYLSKLITQIDENGQFMDSQILKTSLSKLPLPIEVTALQKNKNL
jgi:uridine kinase